MYAVKTDISVNSVMRSKQVVIIARIRCGRNHCWQVLISISLHDRNQRKPQSLSGKTFFTSFPGVNVFSDISLMGTGIQKENILRFLVPSGGKTPFARYHVNLSKIQGKCSTTLHSQQSTLLNQALGSVFGCAKNQMLMEGNLCPIKEAESGRDSFLHIIHQISH